MEPVQILKPRNPGETLKVAETVLKRRHRDLQARAARAQKRLLLKQEAAKKRQDVGIITPEKLVKNSRVVMLDIKRHARLRNSERCNTLRTRMTDKFKTLFVVRNSRFPVSRPSQRVLESLGIPDRYTGTFVPNTPEALLRLRSVSPFVFYGFLNTEVARNLFLKRLRFKEVAEENEEDETRSQKTFVVADNTVVEEKLGHLDVLCIEDLIDEIARCGPHFNDIIQHISAFKLGDIRKAEGLDANILEAGDLGLRINEKVARLL